MSLKEKALAAVDWCKENKDILVVIVPAAAAIIGGGVKLGSRALNTYKVKHLQECTCYDRSLGHYWQLKRPLSNAEWVSIEQRRKNGERLADILTELRVLK